jgi:predicted 3-demethylubiquinone-9 3-methyltransferase (glyoxalase superfamily)
MATLQKIKPYLWYDNQAKEAAEFYCSLFRHAKITSVSDLIVEFELEGVVFVALNGGPKFKFNEAVSFMILCEDQKEVDHFWTSFTSSGGEESMCGWCKDKFGLSWQVVPKRFIEMMETGTPRQTKNVMQVILPMKKMIIEEFEKAFRLS